MDDPVHIEEIDDLGGRGSGERESERESEREMREYAREPRLLWKVLEMPKGDGIENTSPRGNFWWEQLQIFHLYRRKTQNMGREVDTLSDCSYFLEKFAGSSWAENRQA